MFNLFRSTEEKIFAACKNGEPREVSILLSKHTHVARILDKKTELTVEVTPLSIAIAKGNFPVAKLLINNGADVTKYDNINITPYHDDTHIASTPPLSIS